MKKHTAKKLVALFIGICLIFSVYPAYADMGTVGVEPSEPTLAESIPASATEFIDGSFASITNAVQSALDEGSVSPEKDIQIGKPYIVYHFSEYQDEIYYYPLIADGKIEAVLGVIGTDWGYTYEISYNYGLIELLDEMDYLNNDCIFYATDDELYYESENGVSAELTVSAAYSTDPILDADELSFAAMSFEEKQRIIAQKVVTLQPVDTQSFAENSPENIKCGAMKVITLRNKQSQYAYKMCWACVVATIVNTLNWTSYTGYDVCNRMGIGFNTGAEIEEIKTALSYYGVNYKKTTDALGWAEIKQNIDAGYPIAMIMVPYYINPNPEGHSVTLYGYDSSNHYIRIWNSQSNDPEDPYKEGFPKDISYYDQKIDVSSDDLGIAYLWNQTLSEYN